MQIIETGIRNTPQVRLVVIDGIVDLLNDFMDAREAHQNVTTLLSLCSEYNIHIAGILHQNKNDKNARAHIGSISSQKCEMEISTDVDLDDRSRSIVSCVNSRGMPFEPFAIKWEKGCLPIICQDWKPINSPDQKAAKKMLIGKQIAERIFKPFVALSRSEAEKEIMEETEKSESTASRMVNDFLDWGFIIKGDDGKYRIKV